MRKDLAALRVYEQWPVCPFCGRNSTLAETQEPVFGSLATVCTDRCRKCGGVHQTVWGRVDGMDRDVVAIRKA